MTFLEKLDRGFEQHSKQINELEDANLNLAIKYEKLERETKV